jgi:hypothetical protein
LPDEFLIDLEIVVHKNVSQADGLGPNGSRKPLKELLAQRASGFADDLKVV